jgi:hypothetical protein
MGKSKHTAYGKDVSLKIHLSGKFMQMAYLDHALASIRLCRRRSRSRCADNHIKAF